MVGTNGTNWISAMYLSLGDLSSLPSSWGEVYTIYSFIVVVVLLVHAFIGRFLCVL